jgi:hypothetical protein
VRRKIVLGIGALALLLSGGLPAVAQGGWPPPGSAVGRYVPPATALGAGWVVVDASDPKPSPALFRGGAKVVYGGPAGARAVLFAWVVADERKLPDAWASARQLWERYRAAFAADAASAPLRPAAPPPPGCTAAARAEGRDPASEFPAGLSLCAVGTEAIVLAVVSGDLGTENGTAASDRLVRLALAGAAAGSGATPTGSPVATPSP